jgi:hypothetical protein
MGAAPKVDTWNTNSKPREIMHPEFQLPNSCFVLRYTAGGLPRKMSETINRIRKITNKT